MATIQLSSDFKYYLPLVPQKHQYILTYTRQNKCVIMGAAPWHYEKSKFQMLVTLQLSFVMQNKSRIINSAEVCFTRKYYIIQYLSTYKYGTLGSFKQKENSQDSLSRFFSILK